MFPELPLVDQIHINPRLAEAAARYLKEVYRFEDLYSLYSESDSEFSSVDTATAKSAIIEASLNGDITQSANTFGIMLSDVLRARELKRGLKTSAAAKVGHVLTKIYPLIKVALGILQGGADVSFSPHYSNH